MCNCYIVATGSYPSQHTQGVFTHGTEYSIAETVLGRRQQCSYKRACKSYAQVPLSAGHFLFQFHAISNTNMVKFYKTVHIVYSSSYLPDPASYTQIAVCFRPSKSLNSDILMDGSHREFQTVVVTPADSEGNTYSLGYLKEFF